MKHFFRYICTAGAFLLAFCLFGCAPKWELGASAKERTAAPGSAFTVTVTTKNVGGDFKCDHSVKSVGATPSLYQDIGTGRVYLAFDSIETTAEARTVTFAGGETVTLEWTFHGDLLDISNPRAQAAPLGKYTLKLTFQGTEKIFEDFIEIKIAE